MLETIAWGVTINTVIICVTIWRCKTLRWSTIESIETLRLEKEYPAEEPDYEEREEQL